MYLSLSGLEMGLADIGLFLAGVTGAVSVLQNHGLHRKANQTAEVIDQAKAVAEETNIIVKNGSSDEPVSDPAPLPPRTVDTWLSRCVRAVTRRRSP